jgi:hypothetical protein
MRIKGLIPFYSNGFVWHRVGEQAEVTRGFHDLESELLDGEGAEHDDASDALSAAVPLVYPPGKNRPMELEEQIRLIKRDAKWASLDTASREEAVAWERKKMRGVITGDALLSGGSMMDYDTDEDPLDGLVHPSALEYMH